MMRNRNDAPHSGVFGVITLLALLVLSACDSSNGPGPQPTVAPTMAVSQLAPTSGSALTTPTAIPAPMVGSRAPEIALNTYEGKPVTLSDTLKQHKATLVVFWAQWCGDCIQEMPLLDQAYQQYGKGGLEILGVNMADPPDKIAGDVHSVTYPTLLDPNGVAAGAYWVSALPSAFMIGSDGVVKYHYVGPFDTIQFADQLKGLGVNVGQ